MKQFMGMISIFLLASLVVEAQSSHTLTPRTPDIAYVADGHERQVLDVYLPDERPDALPTVFMIHGGAYLAGHKNALRAVAERFVEAGYAVVVPNYRLAPQFTYPAAIEDLFCALAWTYENAASFGLDRSQLILLGESAGGNAAAIIGTTDDPAPFLSDCAYQIPADARPRAVITYYLPVDLSTCECTFAKRAAAVFLGLSPDLWQQEDELRQTFAVVTPLSALDATDPPFLLIHGTDDPIVPLSESAYFVEVAAPLIQTELVLIEGAGHGFFDRVRSSAAQESLEIVLRYLDDLLG